VVPNSPAPPVPASAPAAAPAPTAAAPLVSRVVPLLRAARRTANAVRTENRLVSRYVFNAAPVWRHRRTAAPTGERQRVAEELRTSGVAMTSIEALVGPGDTLRTLQEHVARARIERAPARTSLKPYLIELYGSRPAVDLSDPVFAFALEPQVRGVAEAYAGMALRVQDLNVWINLPTGGDRTQSQRWHRDLPDDHQIIKCFVYLADVPPGAGPLQYVRRTHTAEGRRQRFSSEFDGVGYRVADEDVESTFAREQFVTAEGTAGTIVFADTRGLHRGGFALDTERVVMQITYSSNASTRRRNLVAAPGVERSALSSFRLARGR